MATVQVVSDARPADAVLAGSRAAVESALRTAVGTLPASLQRIAGYHLGWQDEAGHPCAAGGGKAIRPALALLAAEAVGGDPAAAVPAAAAVELAAAAARSRSGTWARSASGWAWRSSSSMTCSASGATRR